VSCVADGRACVGWCALTLYLTKILWTCTTPRGRILKWGLSFGGLCLEPVVLEK